MKKDDNEDQNIQKYYTNTSVDQILNICCITKLKKMYAFDKMAIGGNFKKSLSMSEILVGKLFQNLAPVKLKHLKPEPLTLGRLDPPLN